MLLAMQIVQDLCYTYLKTIVEPHDSQNLLPGGVNGAHTTPLVQQVVLENTCDQAHCWQGLYGTSF